MKKPWIDWGDTFLGWLDWMLTENINVSDLAPRQAYKLYQIMSQPYEATQ